MFCYKQSLLRLTSIYWIKSKSFIFFCCCLHRLMICSRTASWTYISVCQFSYYYMKTSFDGFANRDPEENVDPREKGYVYNFVFSGFARSTALNLVSVYKFRHVDQIPMSLSWSQNTLLTMQKRFLHVFFSNDSENMALKKSPTVQV